MYLQTYQEKVHRKLTFFRFCHYETENAFPIVANNKDQKASSPRIGRNEKSERDTQTPTYNGLYVIRAVDMMAGSSHYLRVCRMQNTELITFFISFFTILINIFLIMFCLNLLNSCCKL